MRNERRALWLGLLLAFLFVRALRALLSTAFYESLVTLRLNTTALWTLALLAPLLAPWCGRRALRLAIVVAGVASAALALARFTDLYLPSAALATASGLLAVALVLRREGAGLGLVAGLALDAGLLVVGRSSDPTLNIGGTLVVIAVTALALFLSLRAHEPPRLSRAPAHLAAGAALAALLTVEIAFLASPFALARWLGSPVWIVATASLGALVVGASLRGGLWLWLVGVAGALTVALSVPVLGPIGLVALQLALGAAASRLAPVAHPFGLGIVIAPMMFVLLFFRSPLGANEWGLIVPLLAILVIAVAIRLAHSVNLHARAPFVAVLLLSLTAAWPTHLSPPDEGREFVVVAYNVHQGFGNRGALDADIYGEILRALDADIILLQESDTARLSSGGLDIVRSLADSLGMYAAYGRAGPAVLSRYPFAGAVNEKTWTLEVPVLVDGTWVHVQSVHLDRDRNIRATQSEELLAAPVALRIVAGDFNFFGGLTGGPYTALTARYDDAWVASGHAVDDPAGFTLSASNPRRRIDLVLVEGLEVVSADRALTETTRDASDHLPVIARLRLPAS